MTETADGGGGQAAAFRGLAIQSGLPLRRVVEMANQGRLLEVVRSISASSRRSHSGTTERRHVTDPNVARLVLRLKRLRASLAEAERGV